MKHARDVLNEIKWRDDLELSKTIIFYRDRNLFGLVTLMGSKILSWDKSFIYTDRDTAIPFHRVEKIVHNDREMFKKPKAKNEQIK